MFMVVVPRSSFQPTCEFGSDRVLVYEELSGPSATRQLHATAATTCYGAAATACCRHDDALPTALSPRIMKASTTTCGLMMKYSLPLLFPTPRGSCISLRGQNGFYSAKILFLGVGNQFLTPLQYANLARLGHELAAEPLAQLVEARAAATRRKSSPAAALITRKRAEASECADCPLLSSRF